jgi:hypothetical protein
MTDIQAYKCELKTGAKIIDSAVFNNVTYHIKDNLIGIDAGKNGRLAIPENQLKKLLDEWSEVYQVHCEVD